MPVLHAATVPLDESRADFGAGVVEALGDGDVFVSLVEFGPEAVGTELFPEVDRIPDVLPEMFRTSQLQRRLPGQTGTQVFFTFRGRAFCLYVVLGNHGRRVGLAAVAGALLRRLTIHQSR